MIGARSVDIWDAAIVSSGVICASSGEGSCCSDDKGMETAKVVVTWSDGCRGGQRSTDDSCVVVMGIPEALVT